MSAARESSQQELLTLTGVGRSYSGMPPVHALREATFSRFSGEGELAAAVFGKSPRGPIPAAHFLVDDERLAQLFRQNDRLGALGA